ncbi:hypothetical protein [Streptomyces erythrochromogenes]|uniref:hypothetical protein n=1 Tax=Streptomyces erythrochromogenes TaxID=285574 RepID=UPI00386B4EA5|nr:hypothetical protein OG364_19295 [Streptomyces erythrochromogenes]
MSTSFEPPVDRTPQELVTELRGLTDVHWETVWNGPPLASQGLDEWCAQFGWTPTQFEYVLNVHTSTGGVMTLNAIGGSWAPVQSLSHWVWGETAVGGPAGNPRVLAEADQVWPLYRDAVSSVLGAPAWDGAWDSAAFPDELGEFVVPKAETRLTQKRPYRIAYWELAAPGGALASLTISPATGTADGSRVGVVNMTFRVYPRPLETGRR